MTPARSSSCPATPKRAAQRAALCLDSSEELCHGGSEEAAQDCDGSGCRIPYGDGPKYWNDRYERMPDPFDWLEQYSDLADLIGCFVKDKAAVNILQVGCGNSLLAEDMYDDGYLDIINIDNSEVVVDQMLERSLREPPRPGLQYLCMDALDMDFPDGSFDVVIDKSLIDTFACGKDSWYTIAKYLKEIVRVLKMGGVLFCISYGVPSSREHFFNLDHLLDFNLTTIELPLKGAAEQAHYLYLCMKMPGADESLRVMWPEVAEALMPASRKPCSTKSQTGDPAALGAGE